jgi:hypothetical protein
MSSILTIYRVDELSRTEFEHAYVNEKKVTYKTGLFGKKEVVTGDQYLWEYLDEAAIEQIDFEYSGFLFIDYFFTFVILPDDLQAELNASARGEHYYLIGSSLASRIRSFLEERTPSAEALTVYANEEGKIEPGYVDALISTHNQIIEWLSSCTKDSFLVLHLTF